MTSSQPGASISEVEVTQIDGQGIWLLVSGAEHFLPYEEYPWFRDARVGEVLNVELLDGGTSGVDLVDEVADRTKVIVIDAAKTDGKPGTVFRFGTADLIRDTERALSLHEFGLLDTLMTAEHLGCAPKEVVIFGIQPKEVSVGLELSAEVAEALPKVIELVLAETEAQIPE